VPFLFGEIYKTYMLLSAYPEYLMSLIDPSFLSILPAYIALGGITGFAAGLLGIGGGTILVPGLYYLFKHFGGDAYNQNELMHMALATSMAIIFPTGLSSSWAQIKREAVEWGAVRFMAGGLILGSLLGVLLVSHLSNDVLKIIFAIGLYGVAATIFFKNEDRAPIAFFKDKICFIPFSCVFGIASILLGMGGAVMNVPYLNRAGYPLKTAIATASVLGVIISFPAILVYIMTGDSAFGFIDPMVLLIVAPFSVLVAPLGVRVSHALPVQQLKIIFSVLMMAVATKMVFEIL